jgi:hypothetical protein
LQKYLSFVACYNLAAGFEAGIDCLYSPAAR